MISPYSNGYAGAAPDAGAMEFSQAPFIAGATLTQRQLIGLTVTKVSQTGNLVDVELGQLPDGRGPANSFQVQIGSGSFGGTLAYNRDSDTWRVLGIDAGSLSGIQSVSVRNDSSSSAVLLNSTINVTPTILVDHTLETGTITARGGNTSNNEGADKVFDNSITTKWLDYSNATWVQFEFNAPRVVSRYIITSGNDTPGRDPKNWTLQGSNDGTNFVTLDTQSNQSFASRNLSKTYNFTNSTPYKMIRLNITANTDGGGITQLREMRLWGPGGTSNPPTSGTPVTLQNPGFESGNLNGWLYGGGAIGVNTVACKSGAYNSFNNGAYNSIFQSVTVQPNSSYTLRAWARLGATASGQNQCIYVSNNGVTHTAWISGTTYAEYSINFTTGSNTSVEIGNYDSGSNVTAYTNGYTLTKN